VLLDDEPLALEVLAGYLGRLDFVDSVVPFSTAAAAMAYLESHEVEVLFLDIEMPGMNGLDFLRALTRPPVTVFTTAYRNYAFEGFELGVIDFLLKPIAYPRFLQTIEKIRDFYSLREQLAKLDDTQVEDEVASMYVKSGVQRIKLYFDEVLYIQGLKDYAIIHTTREKIVLKGSVKAMLDIFPTTRFLRVHKSFIVAVSKIKRLERNRVLVQDHPIPLGRMYREEVEKALLNVR